MIIYLYVLNCLINQVYVYLFKYIYDINGISKDWTDMSNNHGS